MLDPSTPGRPGEPLTEIDALVGHVAGVLQLDGATRAGRVVAGSVAAQMVAGRTATPVLLAAAGVGPPVDVPGFDQIRWHPHETGVTVGWESTRSASPPWDEVVGALAEVAFAPLIAAMRATHRIGARLLWGDIAASLHYATATALRLAPGSPPKVAAMLAALDAVLRRVIPGPSLVTVTSGRSAAVTFERRTCCLIDRAPDHAPCGECPRRSDVAAQGAERRRSVSA